MIPTVWRELQALRAQPTGLAAGDPARGRTFRAALRQAEEFAQAADGVSYATKPVQLFYALNQAGRALAAAASPEPWMVKGHGLSCRLNATSVLYVTVEPSGGAQAAFRMISAATGSVALAGRAEMGALWAANPDLIDVPVPRGLGRWLPALRSDLGTRFIDPRGSEPTDPSERSMATGGTLHAILDVTGGTGEQVAKTLANCPTLAGTAARNAAGDRYIGPASRSSALPPPPETRGCGSPRTLSHS